MQSSTTTSSTVRKTEPLSRCYWTIFFKREDRIESNKEPEPVTSMSGMNEVAACPPTPIAHDSSALLSLTSSPFSSQ